MGYLATFTKRTSTDWGGLFEKFKTYNQLKVFEVILLDTDNEDLIWVYDSKTIKRVGKKHFMKKEHLGSATRL